METAFWTFSIPACRQAGLKVRVFSERESQSFDNFESAFRTDSVLMAIIPDIAHIDIVQSDFFSDIVSFL